MSERVDLVIFGGTGDLSTRKLLPSLYQLHRHGLADGLNRIIATGRGDLSTDSFREAARGNLQEFLPAKAWDETIWEAFRETLQHERWCPCSCFIHHRKDRCCHCGCREKKSEVHNVSERTR